MAILIPAIGSCVSRMTSGEKRFAYRLEDKLEDDYLCWYDVSQYLSQARMPVLIIDWSDLTRDRR